jgi:hypothetical protein
MSMARRVSWLPIGVDVVIVSYTTINLVSENRCDYCLLLPGHITRKLHSFGETKRDYREQCDYSYKAYSFFPFANMAFCWRITSRWTSFVSL